MENIIKNSDDYVKILIITWLKIRDLYLDPKNKSVALNKKIEMLIKASKTIRKQCKKTRKGHSFYYILKFLENEFTSGKKFLTKISHLSLAAKMFELPKPVNQLIDDLGLNNIEDDEFAQAINSMLDDMDENDFKALKDNNELEKTLENIQEGTLVKFMKNKNDNKNLNHTVTFDQEEEKPIISDNDIENFLSNRQVSFKKIPKNDEKLTMNFNEDYKNMENNIYKPKIENTTTYSYPPQPQYNPLPNFYNPYLRNPNTLSSPLPSNLPQTPKPPQLHNSNHQTNINFQLIASQVNAQTLRSRLGTPAQLPLKYYSPVNTQQNFVPKQAINIPQRVNNFPYQAKNIQQQSIYNRYNQNLQKRY